MNSKDWRALLRMVFGFLLRWKKPGRKVECHFDYERTNGVEGNRASGQDSACTESMRGRVDD